MKRIGFTSSSSLRYPGLADRVEALGGALRVSSPVGAGATVTAELPLAAAGSEPRIALGVADRDEERSGAGYAPEGV